MSSVSNPSCGARAPALAHSVGSVGDRVTRLVAARLAAGERAEAVVLGLDRTVRRIWLACWPLAVLLALVVAQLRDSSPVTAVVLIAVVYVVCTSAVARDRALRLVVVTDQSIVVFAARFAPTLRPTRELRRLARSTPLHGRRALTIDLDLGDHVLVSRRFQRTLDRCDQGVPAEPL